MTEASKSAYAASNHEHDETGVPGWLVRSARRAARGPFLRALRELGYLEGGNLLIEYRDAKGNPERFPALAAELAPLKLDVIVTAGGTLGALAAKEATSTVPIVFPAVGDPVADGLVKSLARRG